MGDAGVYARMTTYAFHPAAELFPLIEGQEFDDLVADIRTHGLHEPIALYSDQILDGRNRYRACLEAGVEPRFCEYEGDDAIAFVVSLNLKRRHLSESQRAMIAASIANMRQGERTDLASIDAKSQDEVAELLNVSRSSVQRAAKIQSDGAPELTDAVQRGDIKVSLGARLAKLPRSEQREILGNSFDRNDILTAARAFRQKDTEDRRANRLGMIAEKCANNRDLSGGPFAVILGDPPWQYQNNASDSRKVENHYPTLTLEEICALPVPEIAHKDSILFLWVPSPLIPEEVTVLNAWGFSYRTQFAWDKQRAGMGYYVRNQHGCLFIGVKGKLPPPPTDARHSSVIESPKREHSRKPDEAYEIVEAMYPGLPKVELFARNTREGWAAWGNEIDGGQHGR